MAIDINNIIVIDDNRQFIPSVISAGSTIGVLGQVLQSTGTGVTWSAVIPGTGSGEFNTGITSVTQVEPVSFESTLLTFPSTSGRRYILESINVSNISNEEVNIIAALNYSANNQKVHMAYNVPIVSGGSVELLKQPHIANPSDYITMWSTDSAYAGKSGVLEVYMTYSAVTDTNYFGVGVSTVGIATTSLVGVFTSTTYPSVIQSIQLANRTDVADYAVSVQVTNGLSTSYLVKDMLIPRYSSVEICDRPKRIETNGVVKVSVAQTNTVDVSISGKKIIG
jgi:hypothetical protein